MHVWLSLIVGVLALGPADAPATSSPASPSPLTVAATPRVRTTDTLVRRLLEEGQRRSVTFADLVAAVNATDVIVYIERSDLLPLDVAAQLMLVPVHASPQRYLRVQIRPSLGPNEAIAIIGHELRHALEVAAAPSVRTQAQMSALYRIIGHEGSRVDRYDTAAANTAGLRVKSELVS